MPHSMIIGMSTSGKTTLAKKLANAYTNKGINVLILDPLSDPDFVGSYKTRSPSEFIKVCRDNEHCAVFVDEAGSNVGRFDKEMVELVTRGRHWGHKVHLISQRGVQISTTARDQCTDLYMFTTSLNDCKVHANEWNSNELLTGSSLNKGEYFHTTRFSVCKKYKIF